MSSPPVKLPFYEASAARVWSAILEKAAWVTTAFCLTVAALMLWTYYEDQQANPLAAGDLGNLKAELAARPEDEPLKEEIRRLDQALRENHFHRRDLMLHGSYLLLGGLGVLTLVFKVQARLNQRPVNPLTDLPPITTTAVEISPIRRMVGATGLLLLGGLGAVVFLPHPTFTRPESPPNAPAEGGNLATASSPALATPEELAANWPWFRGAKASVADTAPPEWDGTTGQNILWKTPVPLPGHSSPIVWKDRVFLSGATAKKQEVYCFAANTGKLLWKTPLVSAAKVPAVLDDTGYAPSTMATDGQRVYAMFVTGDVAAFDFSGKLLWNKNLGTPDNTYGHATSLLCWQDRLVVQFDQGTLDDKKSAITAFEGATGKVLWKTPRDVEASWTSPILIRVGQNDQILTAATPWVMAYDPENGQEIWRAECLSGEVAPSPAFTEGMVIVTQEGSKTSAIRADGTGDVTKTHLIWQGEEGLPDIVSPLASNEVVILATSNGQVSCYDLKNGQVCWKKEWEAGFHASPLAVGATVYLTDRAGVTHRFSAAREFKDFGTCPLGEAVSATPAFVAGKAYIRGNANLYCIGKKP